jgi:hypothetical protein
VTSRRAAIWLGVCVAGAAIAVVAWDFLKPGRVAPTLAAPHERATTVVIEKSQRRISLERNGAILKSYEMSLGSSPGLRNGLGWLGAFHLYRDWTDGCIAVTNTQIEEIFRWSTSARASRSDLKET